MICTDHVQRRRKTIISIVLLNPVERLYCVTVSVTVVNSDSVPEVPITVTV